MINFTVGPVQSSEKVCAIGAEQVPYFRTQEFSKLMLENEQLILKFTHAPNNSRCVFLTSSSSGGMEAAIMNTLTKEDKAIVINGGSFGERFVELLSLHSIPFSEIKLDQGKALRKEDLTKFEGKGYTAFVTQKHETSTGVHYDMNIISDFCKRNGMFLIVDTVSSFLCDSFNMEESGVDVMITGSQKALACPPGISIIVLSPNSIERINRIKCPCQYFDLKLALKNQERGQTPWTPAVGILRQINARLNEIDFAGGTNEEIKSCSFYATYFREKIKEYNLPFEIVSESLSNALTPLHPLTQSAYEIFLRLKDEYEIWVCPNGGAMKDSIFRVGHMGNLTITEYDQLIAAFLDLRKRGII